MFPCSLVSRACLYVLLHCFLSLTYLLITIRSFSAAFLADQLDCVSDLGISARSRQDLLIGSPAVASNLIHACCSLSTTGQTTYAYVRSLTIDVCTAGYYVLVSCKVRALVSEMFIFVDCMSPAFKIMCATSSPMGASARTVILTGSSIRYVTSMCSAGVSSQHLFSSWNFGLGSALIRVDHVSGRLFSIAAVGHTMYEVTNCMNLMAPALGVTHRTGSAITGPVAVELVDAIVKQLVGLVLTKHYLYNVTGCDQL